MINKFTTLLVSVALSSMISQAAASASPAVNSLHDLPQQLDQLVADQVMPGSITYIVRNGEIVLHHINGFQDLGSRKAMAENTLFRWYSMSKPITSVAIMMLQEQGKLKVEDPVGKYLADFSNVRVYQSGELDSMKTVAPERAMTIADLLTHQSGLTYHFTGTSPVHQYYRKYGVKRDTPVGALPTDGPPAKDLKQLSERLAKAPLLHQPGEKFSYSYSTTLLGRIIEVVSGERLDSFLQKSLFDPLGMTDAGFFVTGSDLDRFVTNYVMTPAGIQVVETSATTDYQDPKRLLDGGGALAGTAKDYLAFVTMLLNGGTYKGKRLLSQQAIDAMFAEYARIENFGNDKAIGFGYGFAIGTEATESSYFMPQHSYGWAGSGNTIFWLDPKKKEIVLFMTQVITPPPFDQQVPFRKYLIDATKERAH